MTVGFFLWCKDTKNKLNLFYFANFTFNFLITYNKTKNKNRFLFFIFSIL